MGIPAMQISVRSTEQAYYPRVVTYLVSASLELNLRLRSANGVPLGDLLLGYDQPETDARCVA